MECKHSRCECRNHQQPLAGSDRGPGVTRAIQSANTRDKFHSFSPDFLACLDFGLVIFVQSELASSHGQTDRQTESDPYEPTVHRHRCAQCSKN